MSILENIPSNNNYRAMTNTANQCNLIRQRVVVCMRLPESFLRPNFMTSCMKYILVQMPGVYVYITGYWSQFSIISHVDLISFCLTAV